MYNKIVIVGNIGKAELKTLQNGMTLLDFSVATSHSFKKNDVWENKTTWHNCQLWKPSPYIVENAVKGAQVFCEGRVETDEYEKDGVKKYITRIVCETVRVLGKQSKSEGGESTQIFTAPGPTVPSSAPTPAGDDDLPF